MPVDGKFGHVTLEKEPGTPIPDDMPCFVLFARDNAALPTVQTYLFYAEHFGCPPEGLKLIKEALKEFTKWRASNRHLLKVGSSTMRKQGGKPPRPERQCLIDKEHEAHSWKSHGHSYDCPGKEQEDGEDG